MAQRRRVNLKFLGILCGALVAAVVVVAAASFIAGHKDAKGDLKHAQKCIDEGDLTGAVRFLIAASIAEPKNVDTLVRLGNAYHELAKRDPTYEGKDIGAWSSALEIDPTYTPALQKLLAWDISAIEASSQPPASLFKSMNDVAEKLLRINPHDTRAEAYKHIALIAGWLRGIETPDETIDSEITILTNLMPQTAGNPDVPYYIAQAYIRQAQDLRRVNTAESRETALQRVGQAVAIFDSAVQGQPDNAALYLRFYEVLYYANALSKDDENEPAASLLPKMREVLEKARNCVKESDAAFSDTYIYYAQLLARIEKRPEAEAVLRQLLKAKPKDQEARLVLAKFLDADPATRQQAIDLLEMEFEDPGLSQAGISRDRAAMQWNTYYDLTNYLIEQHASTSDSAKRALIMQEIERCYQKLEDRLRTWRLPPKAVSLLQSQSYKLRGKIKLLNNNERSAVEAIQLLEKAHDLLVADDPNRKDLDLLYLMARAYFASRQTGEAERLLRKVCDGWPQRVDARVLLTQLLINKGDGASALEQIGILDQIAPDEPDVWKLKLNVYTMLDPIKFRPLIDHELARIPEDQFGDKVAKAHACVILRYTEKAISLLDSALQEKPADFDAVRQLVALFMDSKDKADGKAKALAVINRALQSDPANNAFKLMKMQLEGDSAAQLTEAELQSIEQIKDPLDRELQKFRYFSGQGNQKEAVVHLDAAEKIKPDDARVLDLRFQVYLGAGNWPKAQEYATKLGGADEAGGRIYSSRLAMARRDYPAAMTIARELIKELPQFSRSWYVYGQVQQAQAQFEPAIESYRVALTKQNENADAWRGIIDCYYKLNRPEDARKAIVAAMQTQPNVAYFADQLVLWHLNYGDPKDALPSRLAARDLHPDSLDAWLNLGAAYFQVATVAMKPAGAKLELPAVADPLRQARETFEQAVKTWPDEPILYAWLADIAVFGKDFEAGHAALLKLAARPAFQGKPDPLVMLANYFEHFGKTAEAEDQYKAALARNPDNVDLRSKLVSFYAQHKKFDEALVVLGPAPKERRLALQWVDTLIQANRLGDAQTALGRLVSDSPKDSQFLTMQGYVLIKANKFPAAMESLNKAIDADPQNAMALYWRGYSRMRQTPPDLDEAIKDLTQARTIKPDYVEAHMLLGDAQQFKNNWEEAVREIETAVQLMPTNDDLRMKLIELYVNASPPRWGEADRVIRVPLADDNQKKDPRWKRTEARLWTLRKDFTKAVASIDAAVNLAPKDHSLLIDYLTIVAQAGDKFDLLRDRCDLLLNDPAQLWAKESWEVYCFRGMARFKLGDKDASLSDFDTAIRNASAKGNQDNVAFVIQTIADTVGVDEAIRRVVDKAASDTHWRVILAALYWKKGDGSAAVKTIDEVLKNKATLSQSEMIAVEGLAGTIFMNTAEYDRAKEIYLELVKLNPTDLATNNNLACIYMNFVASPDLANAQRYSQTAYDTMTEMGLTEPHILDTYGWVKCLMGHPEEGISSLLDSQKKTPLLDSYYHLGEAYLMLREPQANEAAVQLQKAKDLIEKMRKAGEFIDKGLPEKIDRALIKANQLLKAKP